MKRRGPGRPRTRPEGMLIFNALITPEAKARLKALAEIEETYAYRLLEDAFWDRWNNLPEEKRLKAEALAEGIEATLRKEGKPK